MLTHPHLLDSGVFAKYVDQRFINGRDQQQLIQQNQRYFALSMSTISSFLSNKLIFLSKISSIASVIALSSYYINSNKKLHPLLSYLPFTGKQKYFDGERTPITRGYLHGIMAVVHTQRALATGYPAHMMLVVQYIASFCLHNLSCNVTNELQIARVDNLCIASHIFLLAWLGITNKIGRVRTIARSTLSITLLSSLSIGVFHSKGTRAWLYKFSLMPLFLCGIGAWHTSGRLYYPGTPRIPFIYIGAFSLFAAHKKGMFGFEGVLPAVMYDLFHGLQVVATLATLRQVGQL